MALSKTTRDHDEIKQWAEARGAKPAEVGGTESKGEAGILRFEFPDAPHHNDSKLKETSWDEFFEKFDASDLELVYQDVTAEGAQSNFNKLIHPTDENHSKSHGKKAAAGSATKGAAAKKAPAKSAGAAKKAAPANAGSAAKKAAPAKSAAKKTPAKKSSGSSKGK